MDFTIPATEPTLWEDPLFPLVLAVSIVSISSIVAWLVTRADQKSRYPDNPIFLFFFTFFCSAGGGALLLLMVAVCTGGIQLSGVTKEEIADAQAGLTTQVEETYGVVLNSSGAVELLTKEEDTPPLTLKELSEGLELKTVERFGQAEVLVDDIPTQVQLGWLDDEWVLFNLTEEQVAGTATELARQ